MSRFHSVGRHENIHKRSTNVPENKPHHFSIYSSPRTSITGDSIIIPCFATTGTSYRWCLKGFTLVESLAVGLGVTRLRTLLPSSLGGLQVWGLQGQSKPETRFHPSPTLAHQLEKKVTTYIGRVLPSNVYMSLWGSWRAKLVIIMLLTHTDFYQHEGRTDMEQKYPCVVNRYKWEETAGCGPWTTAEKEELSEWEIIR